MPKLRMRSFKAGEVAPGLWGRDDLQAIAHALRRCRGFIITKHGIAVNRSGSLFDGAIKDETRRARLIPFIFGEGQVFVLEFGHHYIRFWTDAGLVLDAGVPYEVASPYDEEHLRDLKYAQSGDIITLTRKGYQQRELRRYSNTNWTLTAIDFSVPAWVPWAAVGTTITSWIEYSYTKSLSYSKRRHDWGITAVMKETATGRIWETQLYKFRSNAQIIDATTTAVWSSGTTYPANQVTRLTNGTRWYSLQGSNLNHPPASSPTWWAPVRIGHVGDIYTSPGVGVQFSLTEHTPTLSWTAPQPPAGHEVVGIRVYRGQGSTFGLLADLADEPGEGVPNSYQDDGTIDPDFAIAPPTAENPFTSDWPGTCAFFEQRRVFGGTPLAPADLFVGKLGDYYSHSPRERVLADDPFSLTLASLRYEEIRWLLPLRALLVGTNEAIWLVSGTGGADDALSADNYRARLQARFGVGMLDPLVVGPAALVISPLGNAVHELLFDQTSDSYQGSELSLLASHLLEERTIVEWAYTRAPFSVAWGVRDDGILLGLSYERDLEVVAWHWHDTDGAYESVCSVPSGTEDVVHVLVRRTVNGQVRRFKEHFASRRVSDARLGVFLDAALTFDGRNTAATTLTVTGAGGYAPDAEVAIAASADVFVAGDVGNDVILDPDAAERTDVNGDPLPPLGPVRLRITAYTNARAVTALVIGPTVPAELQAAATTAWARAVDELAGLEHLEGETVSAVADGNLVEDLVVTDGAVTLATPAAVIRVGLSYVSELETLDIGGDDARSRPKIVKKVFVDVELSRGLEAGRDLEHLSRWQNRQAPVAGALPLETTEVELVVSGEWSKSGRVAVRQRYPFPVSILGVTREVELGG